MKDQETIRRVLWFYANTYQCNNPDGSSSLKRLYSKFCIAQQPKGKITPNESRAGEVRALRDAQLKRIYGQSKSA